MPEVVIVGAGPAGSTLALLLARAGVETLVVDAARFPRPKPCGESLNPGAVAVLDRLGGAPAGVPLRGWRLWASGGPPAVAHYPAGVQGLGCARAPLDAALLARAAAAGAEVALGLRVTGLLWDGPRVAGVWGTAGGRAVRLPARLVVGADGLRSTVCHALNLPLTGRLRKVGFTAHVAGPLGLDDLGEIHLGPDSVVGLAPVGEGQANLTLVVPARLAATTGGDKRGFVRAMLARLPSLAPRLPALRLPEAVLACGPFDHPTRRATAPGALLVGDAAGYFDPLTGQGIYRALRSAELAAPVALQALARGDWTLLSGYDQELRRAFGPGRRLQRVIEQVLARPHLLTPALGLLRWSPALATWLLKHVGDCP